MKGQRYSKTAITIHWMMAIVLIGIILLGFYMVDLPKGIERSNFFKLHKSIGLTLALLVVFRLVWRYIVVPPALPEYIGTMQRRLANLTHYLLYFFMFLMPLSGYLSSSFAGYKTSFWGIALPHWGWKVPQLNEFFSGVHEISAWCFLSLLALHITGVIYHLLKRQPELFKRMWFR